MPGVGFRRDCVLAFSTHFDELSFSFAQCEGVVPSVFMFFFPEEIFSYLCVYSVCLWEEESSRSSCVIILAESLLHYYFKSIFLGDSERRGKQKQKRKLSTQDPNCETQTVCVSGNYFHPSSGSHQSWATLRLIRLLEPCCSEGQGACR